MLRQLVRELNGVLGRRRAAVCGWPDRERALAGGDASQPDARLIQAYNAYYDGDLVRAHQLCDELAAFDPRDPNILYLDAELRARAGDVHGALASYQRAIDGKPDFVDAYINMGLLLRDNRQPTEADQVLQAALELDPENARIHNNLATVYIQQKKFGMAARHLGRALMFGPELAEVHCNLGIVAEETGDRELAEASFRKACELKPDYVDAYSNFGLALRQWERYQEAEQCLRRAIELQPNSVLAHCNLGYVMLDQVRPDAALECFRRAVAIKPDNVEALVSCGLALRDQGDIEAGVEYFERALALEPDFPEARLNRASYWLLTGRLKQGWEDYEYRLRTNEAHARLCRVPQADGGSLEHKRVLVFGEQGLGDEILFASCVPDVLRDASACTVECDARLVNLFQRSFPQALVREKPNGSVPASASGEHFDVQVPVGSLPRLYRNARSDFPAHAGYLEADAEKVRRWRHRLDALGTGVKVGLSWRGGLGRTRRLLRSIALSEWGPVLQREGVHFVSLQYTACEEDLAAVEHEQGVRVHHWSEAIADYDETAALVSALDLVVSVCTSVVSLGGALGRPVWVLVPSSPGWMFLREGERMPWFPSLRLFRQAEANVWGPVLAQVGEELGRLVAGASAGAGGS